MKCLAAEIIGLVFARPAATDVTERGQFYQWTCGCDKDQENHCSKQFPFEYYIQQRAQSSFLTKDELDLVLMSFVSSAMLDSKVVKDGRHLNPANTGMSQWAPWCRCLQKNRGIGKDRLQNIKDHESLQAHVYKNTKRSPYHGVSFDDTTYILDFLENFTK